MAKVSKDISVRLVVSVFGIELMAPDLSTCPLPSTRATVIPIGALLNSQYLCARDPYDFSSLGLHGSLSRHALLPGVCEEVRWAREGLKGVAMRQRR